MTLADVVVAKKWELDALRPALRPDALDELERSHHIDVTFTSNALDGNAMSIAETVLILEKGKTIVGKPLKDHLEVVEQAKALEWAFGTGSESRAALNERDIKSLHRQLTTQSMPAVAGRYADRPRKVEWDGGKIDFPQPADVPPLMAKFYVWLATAADGPTTAFDAHLKLISIHPFNDGNGRAARLLTNLLLARAGYPPIAIRPEQRPAYLGAVHAAQTGNGERDFRDLMYTKLDQTMDLYLAAARQAKNAPAGTA